MAEAVSVAFLQCGQLTSKRSINETWGLQRFKGFFPTGPSFNQMGRNRATSGRLCTGHI